MNDDELRMARAELDKIKDILEPFRAGFEMAVEATCLEITDLAKQISSAIGEISVDEANEVIIREFSRRLRS